MVNRASRTRGASMRESCAGSGVCRQTIIDNSSCQLQEEKRAAKSEAKLTPAPVEKDHLHW
jgi:hypothetical protein